MRNREIRDDEVAPGSKQSTACFRDNACPKESGKVKIWGSVYGKWRASSVPQCLGLERSSYHRRETCKPTGERPESTAAAQRCRQHARQSAGSAVSTWRWTPDLMGITESSGTAPPTLARTAALLANPSGTPKMLLSTPNAGTLSPSQP